MDLIYLAALIAFFALTAALAVCCKRLGERR